MPLWTTCAPFEVNLSNLRSLFSTMHAFLPVNKSEEENSVAKAEGMRRAGQIRWGAAMQLSHNDMAYGCREL